jgi:hypothetical protein
LYWLCHFESTDKTTLPLLCGQCFELLAHAVLTGSPAVRRAPAPWAHPAACASACMRWPVVVFDRGLWLHQCRAAELRNCAEFAFPPLLLLLLLLMQAAGMLAHLLQALSCQPFLLLYSPTTHHSG